MINPSKLTDEKVDSLVAESNEFLNALKNGRQLFEALRESNDEVQKLILHNIIDIQLAIFKLQEALKNEN